MKIIKKPKSPNTVWDVENNRPLCVFPDSGIMETEDKGLIDALVKLGHTPEEEPKAQKGKG